MTSIRLTRRALATAAISAMAGCAAPRERAATVAAVPKDGGPEMLLVGPDQHYKSITAAGERLAVKWDPFAKTPNHDPIHMIISPGPPGYYDQDVDSYSRKWPKNNHGGWPPYHGNLLGPAVIEGEPGKPAPELTCSGGGEGVIYLQQGAFITSDYDTTFRRLNFDGFKRPDGQGNYSAIRIGTLGENVSRPGNMLFEDVRLTGCDDGILGGSPGQTVTLRRCEFRRNGGPIGRTHNIYIGPVDLLTVEDTLSTQCEIGHLLKSRAARTIIRRTRLIDIDGTASACLDVPDGGVLEMEDVICEKSPKSDASWVIHYGGENQDAAGVMFHPVSSISIRNLVMIAPARLTRHPSWPILGFANQSGAGEAASGKGSRLIKAEASNVKVYGLDARQAGLPGVQVLSAPPQLDVTSPVRI